MSKTILITGGAGFVGSNLAIGLKGRYPDYELVCFDNLSRSGSELNPPRLVEKGIRFIEGDIRNRADLEGVGKFDVMIEASAEPSVLAGLDNDTDFIIQNNFNGSVHCLDAAVANKADFIFLSTSRVYPIEGLESLQFEETDTRFELVNQEAKGASREGISEEFDLDGYRSMYGATKLASELIIKEYGAWFGLRAAINRCGVIAGPWQMGKIDQGVAALWLARHYWNKSLAYIGYGGLGKQVRDMLHVNDLLDLVDMQIHQMDTFAGKTYNAGGGLQGSLSLIELTDLCEEITGNKIDIASEPETRQADVRIYITDNSRITRETGWAPKLTPKQILTDTFAWMQAEADSLGSILA
jgi:CDP-paratose 2-epimerase